MFGVADAPLTGCAGPLANEELIGRIGEVVGDGLLGVAGQETVGCWSGLLDCDRAGEGDDLGCHDVEGKPKKPSIAGRLRGVRVASRESPRASGREALSAARRLRASWAR